MVSGISLWGLFEYTNETLFDQIELTEKLDKDILVTNIIDKWGTVDLYQQNPIIVKRKINTFFLTNYDNFDKIAEVMQQEYNPLENYDRLEDTKENRDKTGAGVSTNNSTGSTTSSASGNSTSAGSSQTNLGASDTEHKTSADNEVDYQRFGKDISSARTDETASSDTLSNTSSANGSNTENSTATHSTSETDGFNRDSRIHGNIGTVSSQMLLLQELDVRKFNIYDYIADLFASEFLVRVF